MGSPLCILLVDDSKFFLELEKQFLRNTPATILTASSGEVALALAREYRPSLVYMDMNLPDMAGFDCCRRFKSDPELQQIPLVLIGTADPEINESESRVAGADAYLPKPLNRTHFLAAGHSFLVSIDRRETRRTCQVPVSYLCRGRRLQGHCIDVSSGGMFLLCQPTAQKGEDLLLTFSLPDVAQTSVEIHGRVAWGNTREEINKEDFPLGYGLEFVDIPDSIGVALRRCFGT